MSVRHVRWSVGASCSLIVLLTFPAAGTTVAASVLPLVILAIVPPLIVLALGRHGPPLTVEALPA